MNRQLAIDNLNIFVGGIPRLVFTHQLEQIHIIDNRSAFNCHAHFALASQGPILLGDLQRYIDAAAWHGQIVSELAVTLRLIERIIVSASHWAGHNAGKTTGGKRVHLINQARCGSKFATASIDRMQQHATR